VTMVNATETTAAVRRFECLTSFSCHVLVYSTRASST
jgi:hypothetical protein